ncbi:nitroreductase family protein [Pyramidobacter sp. C12-8]|uniref:nitroreductase family protein n=1 Tax=Pyramidobacter sp. C12-8 TaxID=1943580 RepID=UPI0009C9601E|nr:nitroreductase family protein [Pyramidobacter sp. C12-8]OON88699.1 hypothetical protein B0D78_07360 [Pyramidobacter sp. C12-8]
MNTVIQNILSRRSIRNYSDTPVELELLRTIIDCGLHAPTGHNTQRVRLFVQTKHESLARINAVIQRELLTHKLTENDIMDFSVARAKAPHYHFIYHAPVLISAVAPRDRTNGMAECAAAVENMLLAAHSLGLGACWINQPHWFTDVPALRALFVPLGLTDDEVILASLCVGHTNIDNPPVPSRKDGRIQSDISL